MVVGTGLLGEKGQRGGEAVVVVVGVGVGEEGVGEVGGRIGGGAGGLLHERGRSGLFEEPFLVGVEHLLDC